MISQSMEPSSGAAKNGKPQEMHGTGEPVTMEPAPVPNRGPVMGKPNGRMAANV
jgi:hypothetical protein